MSALDDLLDKKDREIARLGSLLDDAVDLLIAWLLEPEPVLPDKTAAFLAQPEVDKIVVALNKANWKRAPIICPACGADYAEAEAKNARLAKALGNQFAELEVVRLKEEHAVYAPAMVNLLDAGAVGTIVHVHQPLDPKPAYEVEFTDDAGKTIAVLTLRDDEIEKMT